MTKSIQQGEKAITLCAYNTLMDCLDECVYITGSLLILLMFFLAL